MALSLDGFWRKTKMVIAFLVCAGITVSFFLGAMPIGGVGYALGVASALLFAKWIR